MTVENFVLCLSVAHKQCSWCQVSGAPDFQINCMEIIINKSLLPSDILQHIEYILLVANQRKPFNCHIKTHDILQIQISSLSGITDRLKSYRQVLLNISKPYCSKINRLAFTYPPFRMQFSVNIPFTTRCLQLLTMTLGQLYFDLLLLVNQMVLLRKVVIPSLNVILEKNNSGCL